MIILCCTFLNKENEYGIVNPKKYFDFTFVDVMAVENETFTEISEACLMNYSVTSILVTH